jgi:hypothetical protein
MVNAQVGWGADLSAYGSPLTAKLTFANDTTQLGRNN